MFNGIRCFSLFRHKHVYKVATDIKFLLLMVEKGHDTNNASVLDFFEQ